MTNFNFQDSNLPWGSYESHGLGLVLWSCVDFLWKLKAKRKRISQCCCHNTNGGFCNNPKKRTENLVSARMSITGTNTPIRKSVRVKVENRKPASISIPSTNPTPSIGTDVNNGRQHPNLMFGSYKGCKEKQWATSPILSPNPVSSIGKDVNNGHQHSNLTPGSSKGWSLKRTRHLGHENLFTPGDP
jgi:hypothetical protein